MDPATPTANTPGRRPGRTWWAGLLVLAVVVVLAVLYFHRPEGQFFYPRCTFHQVTGCLCPGCGGLRAGHALLHGRWAEAARCNLLLVIALPAMAVVALGQWRNGSARTWAPGARAVWWIFGITTVFTVLRNLPVDASGWLRP